MIATVDAAARTERLITEHLPWVHQHVKEIAARVPSHVDADALASAGLLALVLSARSYDEARGVPFIRYAAARVRGAMLDELRALDGAGRATRRRVRRVDAGVEQLGAALGRTPSTAELAAFLELSVTEITAALAEVHRTTPVHLEELTPEVAANLLRDNDLGPEESLLHTELVQGVREGVDALPPRLRTIVVGRFLHDRSTTELADELGLSMSRVSQLCTEALHRVRSSLTTRFDAPPRLPSPRGREEYDRIVPAQSQR